MCKMEQMLIDEPWDIIKYDNKDFLIPPMDITHNGECIVLFEGILNTESRYRTYPIEELKHKLKVIAVAPKLFSLVETMYGKTITEHGKEFVVISKDMFSELKNTIRSAKQQEI